jgi:hypothetical protein
MISFSKDYDKEEGIINAIVLPDVSRIQSDETIEQIKDNNFENFSDLTGSIFKNLILSFEIFQLPPLAGIFNDFPLVFQNSMANFKNGLIANEVNAYSNFINDLFSLFDPSKNPNSDLVPLLAPLTIQLTSQGYSITNEDINNITSYLNEIKVDMNNEQLKEVNSYVSYFIIKFVSSNFLLTFTPAPPAAPIILPLITLDPPGPLTIDIIKNELKQKIDNIVENK